MCATHNEKSKRCHTHAEDHLKGSVGASGSWITFLIRISTQGTPLKIEHVQNNKCVGKDARVISDLAEGDDGHEDDGTDSYALIDDSGGTLVGHELCDKQSHVNSEDSQEENDEDHLGTV